MVIGLSMLGQIFYAKRMNMNLFRMWPLGFLVSNFCLKLMFLLETNVESSVVLVASPIRRKSSNLLR